ncbi:hypothetical protein J2Y86_000930 [Pseudomonas migulae]|uniref:hypothetical protein n=1 Tax=Pseudomonas migulae TaxID=78543 RepID=UPI0020A0BE6A|nr:hypothetical protein [Pseudomonas migulae]MCP1496223.1 hypothetical protein [Pseudomonas migulae]
MAVLTHASDPRLLTFVITKGTFSGQAEAVASPMENSPWGWLNNQLNLGWTQVRKPKYWFGVIDKLSDDHRFADVVLYGSGNFGERGGIKIFPHDKKNWTRVPIKYFGDNAFFSFETGDHVVLDFAFTNSPTLIGFAQEPRLREIVGQITVYHIISIGRFFNAVGVVDDKHISTTDKDGKKIPYDPWKGPFYAFAPINYGYKYSGSNYIIDVRRTYFTLDNRDYSSALDGSATLYTYGNGINLITETDLIAKKLATYRDYDEYTFLHSNGYRETRYLSRSFSTFFHSVQKPTYQYGKDYELGVRYDAVPFFTGLLDSPYLRNRKDLDIIFYRRSVGRTLETSWYVDKYSPMLTMEGYFIRKEE